MKNHIEALLKQALDKLVADSQITSSLPSIQIDATKDKQHGDFASNIALVLAKTNQMKPRDLAEKIISAISPSTNITRIEIAGPGFINFFVAHTAFHQIIADILQAGENYAKVDIGKQQRVIVEFVSSNPTGPLHVGHGRHAAYGTVVSNLLTFIGYAVHREYYVNDAGRQMDILTVSVWLRYLTLLGEKINFPANGYKGEYVVAIAEKLIEKYRDKFNVATKELFEQLPLDEPLGGDKEIYIDALIDRAKILLGDEHYLMILHLTLDHILADIRSDLLEFGVYFDQWFSEATFVKTDAVEKMIQQLSQAGLTYEKEGALWFRSTDFSDEKDRVLQRSNRQRTYFANDLAYHINKFTRGFNLSIDIWGSDHHGYVPRMKAGLTACGIPGNDSLYLLVQFVTLYRGGEQAQMSTRSGSFVTLRELRAEVGNDAARFFYVMRRCEQHMDFDLDLAKAQSNENPVYYIQYAYARICSVFRQLKEKELKYDQEQGLQNKELLVEAHELQLLGTLARYAEMIRKAAIQYEPHLLTNYLRELANDFHAYYNSHQFLVEEPGLRNARLALILASRQLLANGLQLLGVSTPESM